MVRKAADHSLAASDMHRARFRLCKKGQQERWWDRVGSFRVTALQPPFASIECAPHEALTSFQLIQAQVFPYDVEILHVG